MKKLIETLKSYKRFIFNDLFSYLAFEIYYKRMIEASSMTNDLAEGVTVVITSCARPEKLNIMLRSFIRFNTFTVAKYIFVEDAGCEKSVEIARSILIDAPLEILFHEINQGQLNSIDEAYEKVLTKYVFHLEEDWEFFESGFIEYSFSIMQNNPEIVSLSLRPHDDWKKWAYEKNNGFCIFNTPSNFIWQGISINPGLYDITKYHKIGCYAKFKKERHIVQAYRKLGYKGAISDRASGFVIHTGENDTTRKKYKVA